jgi:hypothetical protein
MWRRSAVGFSDSSGAPTAGPDGLVAEWLRRGLQILVRGFDSLRGLQRNQIFSELSENSKKPGLRGDDKSVPGEMSGGERWRVSEMARTVPAAAVLSRPAPKINASYISRILR